MSEPKGEASLHRISINEENAGQRLDKVLAAALPDLSRTRVQALLEAGQIHDKHGKALTNASLKARAGDTFTIAIPPPAPSHIAPVKMPLDIVYEDEDMLVVNKPAGLTVHPAPGHAEDTLVNGLLAHCDDLSGIGGVERPGIVHRIDKDTSGLLVVAKHDKAHNKLAKQLKNRTLKRLYKAIVWGVPAYAEGTIEGDIGRNPHDRKKMAVVKSGGKPATTHYTILETFRHNRPVKGKADTLQRDNVAAFVECELETGRTHQIRVHFTHHHHALVGDPVYGKDTGSRLNTPMGRALPEEVREKLLAFNRQALHACELHLIHPISKEAMVFESPLPDDFFMVLDALRTLK